jgi:hypothetical protein
MYNVLSEVKDGYLFYQIHSAILSAAPYGAAFLFEEKLIQ